MGSYKSPIRCMLYAIGRNMMKYHRFLHYEIEKFDSTNNSLAVIFSIICLLLVLEKIDFSSLDANSINNLKMSKSYC